MESNCEVIRDAYQNGIAPTGSSDVEKKQWEPVECWMRGWDGTALFYRAWNVAESRKKALILFHRGHEHSGRWQDFVERLGLDDVAIFAWDARGHGRSPGERGYAPSFGHLVKDADSFVRHVSVEYGIPVEDIVVLGHSVGAVIASTWVHDYCPPIKGLVLGTPAFRVKLYVPYAVEALRVLQKIKKKSFVKSYVKSRFLTHDPEMAKSYDSDEFVSRDIAVNVLLDLYDHSTRVMNSAASISTPTLMLLSGADLVVDLEAPKRFFEKLSSKTKEMEIYPGFYHALFHEKDRAKPIERVRRFVLECFASEEEQGSAVEADTAKEAGLEKAEFVRELGVTEFKFWNFAAQKLVLGTVGRLSKGVRVGWRTGFDSGESLDHVYRNKPEGYTPIGRLIDRCYLESTGWRCIRERKKNLQTLLEATINRVHEDTGSVRLLDIASGPGRYMLETLQRYPDYDIQAVCRDRDKGGLEAGRKLAFTLGIPGVSYLEGDAFSRASITSVTPRPNIAIVSGLYELFPENKMIRESLKGVSEVLHDDGFLIYTNQPHHPQLEMIARVLINRDGVPWVMRCRSQAEMDELVREAGFEKIDMLIDNEGIFSVSLARKVSKQ